MAVISKNKNDKLIFEIDNGDLTKLNEVMKKWNFKDYQSFMRFVVSIMLLNEDNFLSIKVDGVRQNIAPASHSIKE